MLILYIYEYTYTHKLLLKIHIFNICAYVSMCTLGFEIKNILELIIII